MPIPAISAGIAMGIALGLTTSGCDSLSKDDPSTDASPADASPADASPADANPTDANGADASRSGASPTDPSSSGAGAKPPGPSSLLAGVIDRAIAPPPEGGSTYRVDAYVAALVVEHLRHDPLPFTAWRNRDPSDQSKPAAGYRVGPLPTGSPWARLGLAEGDVIEEVNGISTAEPGWISPALARADNRVTVSIFRDDVSFVLSYRLMGGMAWLDLVDEQSARGSDEPTSGADDPESNAVAMTDDPLGVGGGAGDPRGGGGGAGAGGSGAGGGVVPSSGGKRPSPSGGRRPSPSRGGASTPRPSGNTVARCASASSCTLDKVYFDSLVRSPAKLESQARVVPAIRNDVFSGYKLKTVRSGSAVQQLGFRSGDKITHINGRDLTNDLEAMQLYMGLSNTRTFRVRYVRGGSTRNKTITVN